MRSAGVTAADAVGYYLPEWLSPRPRKSIRCIFPCRHHTTGDSLEGSFAGTPLTHRFLRCWTHFTIWRGDLSSPFLSSGKNIGAALQGTHGLTAQAMAGKPLLHPGQKGLAVLIQGAAEGEVVGGMVHTEHAALAVDMLQEQLGFL